jgi:hypothetical protein
MSSQCEQHRNDNRGQEDQQRKHERSTSRKRDSSRRIRTWLPSSHQARNRASTKQLISPSAHLDVATILSGVLPEWEVEETTHIPMHMKNCEDCIHFALHVASQTRGSTSEILIEKQKRHWCKVLEKDFKKAREDGRKLTDKEKDSEIERLNNEVEDLRDKISWYHSQLNAIEDDNNDLQREVWRARDAQMTYSRAQFTGEGPAQDTRVTTHETGHMKHETDLSCTPRDDQRLIAHHQSGRLPACS